MIPETRIVTISNESLKAYPEFIFINEIFNNDQPDNEMQCTTSNLK